MKWKYIVLLSFVALLFYTRFVGLSWGLPYPFHPDERNMVDAMLRMHCQLPLFTDQFTSIKDCFNPDFWAYGQVPLYLGLLASSLYKIVIGTISAPRSYFEAAMGLRLISALASAMTSGVMLLLLKSFFSYTSSPNLKDQKLKPNIQAQKYDLTNQSYLWLVASFLIIIFSPYLIQFAHFGTTESLLMLFFTGITYVSLKELTYTGTSRKQWLILGALCGLAVATKVSALIFVGLPVCVLLWKMFAKKNIRRRVADMFLNSLPFVITFCIIAALCSIQSILHWDYFTNSIRYESSVGLGTTKVFYTQQFENTIPVLFQMMKILPFSVELDVFLAGILGFFFLSWKDARMNVLRIALLLSFLPNAFLYAKWTRFIAASFPLFTVFGILVLVKSYYYLLKKLQSRKHGKWYGKIYPVIFAISIASILLPGIGYISIYTTPDVRYRASVWMQQNISARSKILQESGNAIDLPVFPIDKSGMYRLTNFEMNSFDFYTLDSDPSKRAIFPEVLASADYVLVPSRRVWADYACLRQDQISKFKDQNVFQNIKLVNGYFEKRCDVLDKKYPYIKNYYENLLNENDFTLVKEFTSYPRIILFGKTIYELSDEGAEETWTVFDHPVIRVFRRKP